MIHDMHVKYLASQIAEDIVSDTHLTITCAVEIVVDICENVGSICPFNMLAVRIYLECGSHICWVIHVKNVYSAPCCMIDVSDFICGKYVCIHPPYMHIQ